MEQVKMPKKSLGQNFLIDPNYRRKIIETVSPSLNDEIVEIGPGRGILTSELVGRCRHLWLVEKDASLAAALKTTYSDEPKATVLTADFLELDLKEIWGEPPRQMEVVGNLPYNVASQIFIRLIENRLYFSDLYLMFQKEMARRFTAEPRTRDYGLLTLWAKIYTECKIAFHLPPTAFRPRPKVDSSFVHFKIREEPLIPDKEAPAFFGLLRLLFQQRRKTIASALKAKNISIQSKKIPPNARAEELSVEELIRLAREAPIDLPQKSLSPPLKGRI
ncbi:MAG: ribosomal RNA small subunit methyltransferase A [Deltaproteobacteria bacterium]|nr:ribosomal RNA small subunit methyltransferase A [Deltaproteobacteria bacterium]